MPIRVAESPRQWTPEQWQHLVESRCGAAPVLVLANREPIRHEHGPTGRIVACRSASGLVTAIEPVIAACGGTWIAHGSGGADRLTVDASDSVDVASGERPYRLRRVWLDAEEERRYYHGFANEGLWPMCHRVHVRPVFRAADFATYAHVNDRFAAVVCEEADGAAPLVLVQDYHFALAPRRIRARMPAATIITFWHIPWPTPRDFEICPWGRELLSGLLGSSVVGFHTPDDCAQFLDTVDAVVTGARVDRVRQTVSFGGQTTIVKAYPIPLEWCGGAACDCPPADVCRHSVRAEEGLPDDALLIVGIDRLDYTKGLCEKITAVEHLLHRYPEYRGRVTLLQVAEPSRTYLRAYRDLSVQVGARTADVNGTFAVAGWRPVVVRYAHHDASEVYRLMRAADVCYVGSLHDGMNLVAKEFVASRCDEQGALVLSTFAGAARELSAALMINPYDAAGCADTLARALRMNSREQQTRMRALRATVSATNSYWWAGQMLEDAQTGALARRDALPLLPRRAGPRRQPLAMTSCMRS